MALTCLLEECRHGDFSHTSFFSFLDVLGVRHKSGPIAQDYQIRRGPDLYLTPSTSNFATECIYTFLLFCYLLLNQSTYKSFITIISNTLSAPIVSQNRNLTPTHSINMSSSILSNLAKTQKLKGRSNYQSWKSTMEGVLELQGLWDIVSGKQLRPEIRNTTPATRSIASSIITSSNSEALDAWVIRARRAWITIDLSIVNELRHITKTFSKEDPVVLWKHLEKKY